MRDDSSFRNKQNARRKRLKSDVNDDDVAFVTRDDFSAKTRERSSSPEEEGLLLPSSDEEKR